MKISPVIHEALNYFKSVESYNATHTYKYNYRDSMKVDILNAIIYDYPSCDFDDIKSVDDLYDFLEQDLRIADDVTGGNIGIYDDGRYPVEQRIFDNPDLFGEIIENPENKLIFSRFLAGELDLDSADVAIRQHILASVLQELLPVLNSTSCFIF